MGKFQDRVLQVEQEAGGEASVKEAQERELQDVKVREKKVEK